MPINGTDTVTVTVTRTSPTYLLGLFGKSSIPALGHAATNPGGFATGFHL